MKFATRLLLPVLAAAAFAAPAHAQSLRIPNDGKVPAIEVVKQSGWTERYDDYGNLTLFADDKSGGLLFRMIEAGPTEPMPATATIAEVILSSAGAKPYTRTEKTSFAGGPADAYYSAMGGDGKPVVQLKVVIRQTDARHLAVGVTMVPDTATPAQRAAIEAQFVAAQVVNK